jgi:uncharacterized protein YdeI (YjbR/CyaY-like superfamily)
MSRQAPVKKTATKLSRAAKQPPSTGMKTTREPDATLSFASPAKWQSFLRAQHAKSRGVWLRIARKGSGIPSVTYPEALEVALAWGWIDGQKARGDEQTWLQRFTPRTARSPWSQINCRHAEALIAAGRMQAPGLAEVERAKGDGRWQRAYAGARSAETPPDFLRELAKDPSAKAFYAKLNAANLYAIRYRLQTAKKPETRARRMQQLLDMLARGETIHPQ